MNLTGIPETLQAVQILAQHFGLSQEPANNPPIEMPPQEDEPSESS